MEKRNLRIYQGSDFAADFDVPGIMPSAIVTAEVRRWANGPRIATFSADINVGAGTVTIRLSDAITSAMTRGGVYDLSVTQGSETTTIAFGVALLQARVGVEPTGPTMRDLTWDDMTQTWDDLSDALLWETLPEAFVLSDDLWPAFNSSWDSLSDDLTWETI